MSKIIDLTVLLMPSGSIESFIHKLWEKHFPNHCATKGVHTKMINSTNGISLNPLLHKKRWFGKLKWFIAHRHLMSYDSNWCHPLNSYSVLFSQCIFSWKEITKPDILRRIMSKIFDSDFCKAIQNRCQMIKTLCSILCFDSKSV